VSGLATGLWLDGNSAGFDQIESEVVKGPASRSMVQRQGWFDQLITKNPLSAPIFSVDWICDRWWGEKQSRSWNSLKMGSKVQS